MTAETAARQAPGPTPRSSGTVTRFDAARGSGSIGRAHVGRPCTVMHSALRGTVLGILAEGDRVEFDLIEGAQGPSARNVVRVSG